MHAPQPTIYSYGQKRPLCFFFVAEMSMAEMSRPKLPRPKCPTFGPGVTATNVIRTISSVSIRIITGFNTDAQSVFSQEKVWLLQLSKPCHRL